MIRSIKNKMDSEFCNYMDCNDLNDSDDTSIYTIDYKIGEDGSDCLIMDIDKNIFMDEDVDSDEEKSSFVNSSIGHNNTSLY